MVDELVDVVNMVVVEVAVAVTVVQCWMVDSMVVAESEVESVDRHGVDTVAAVRRTVTFPHPSNSSMMVRVATLDSSCCRHCCCCGLGCTVRSFSSSYLPACLSVCRYWK